MSAGSASLDLVDRIRLRESQMFFALTVLIGVVSGISAVLFTLAINATKHGLFGASPSNLRLFLVPTLVSLVTGFLLAKFFPDSRGSGVPQTEAAYHLNKGVIPARVPFGKFITGVLCVGSGHSMGREGPSVQIGAGLASLIGRWAGLSPARVQSLVPIGAAAALAAAFNTPVAAVLFALEEIIGDMNAGLIGSTVVASVTAVIVERSLLGNEALFRVPAYHLVHPAEILAYALLGIVGGVISVVFCKSLLGVRKFFLDLPEFMTPYAPAIGGAIIGVVLIFFPQVMGVGYEYVDQSINGGMVLKTLLVLLVMKIVATVISFASGNSGGIFAPALYIGAMAGGAAGILVHRFAPFPTGDAGAYALVGMGTLFAGIIRAPITSVFMIFELTQDYQILVPLMVANLLSFVISRHYQHQPVYHALLEQNHIHLPGPETRVASGTWRASDIMSRDFKFVDPGATIDSILAWMESGGVHWALVGDSEDLQGLTTRSRIVKAKEEGLGRDSVASVLLEKWPFVHPDNSLELTLERYRQATGVLPVLNRNNSRQVVGVVTLDSVIRFVDKNPSV